MAIDFPASPTLNDVFTVGTVNYVWDGTKWTAAVTGGIALDKIEEGDTKAEVIDTGADGRFVVTTQNTERLRVDSSGRVGIGTASPGEQLEVHKSSGSAQAWIHSSGGGGILTKLISERSGPFRISAEGGSASGIVFETGNSVTPVERARIDTSGRVLVGTSSASGFQSGTKHVLMDGAGTSYGSVSIGNPGGGLNNTDLNITAWSGSGSNYYTSKIRQIGDGSFTIHTQSSASSDGAGSPTERMRISNIGGLFTYTTDAGGYRFATGQGASTDLTLIDGLHSASGVNTGTAVFKVRTNGNVQNTNNSYGSLSDIKLKENIVDATSQWNDLKALQVRKYNFKEGQTHTQIGLVAQEVELVSPGLVTESPDRDAEGNDLGTVTKSVNYSVLYMKAVKALQEAMERIETLETKVAALESA